MWQKDEAVPWNPEGTFVFFTTGRKPMLTWVLSPTTDVCFCLCLVFCCVQTTLLSIWRNTPTAWSPGNISASAHGCPSETSTRRERLLRLVWFFCNRRLMYVCTSGLRCHSNVVRICYLEEEYVHLDIRNLAFGMFCSVTELNWTRSNPKMPLRYCLVAI